VDAPDVRSATFGNALFTPLQLWSIPLLHASSAARCRKR